jgi:putative membrane protein
MAIKKYLRLFLINLASLWLISQILAGVSWEGRGETLTLAALSLTLINLVIKPLIKVLLLPINLLTLGAFRWLVNVIALYLVTLIIPQFKVESFVFPGFSWEGFVIPSFPLGTFWVFVIASFLISLITSFLLWLIK